MLWQGPSSRSSTPRSPPRSWPTAPARPSGSPRAALAFGGIRAAGRPRSAAPGRLAGRAPLGHDHRAGDAACCPRSSATPRGLAAGRAHARLGSSSGRRAATALVPPLMGCRSSARWALAEAMEARGYGEPGATRARRRGRRARERVVARLGRSRACVAVWLLAGRRRGLPATTTCWATRSRRRPPAVDRRCWR